MAAASSAEPARPADLAGRVALVTGASSGIGRAVALHLSSRGAALLCADLREHARETGYEDDRHASTVELIRRRGGDAAFVTCDVGDLDEIAAAVAAADELDGEFCIAVFNAGVYLGASSILEEKVDEHDLTMRVNERGVWAGVQAAARLWSMASRRGRIVCTASTWGMRGGPGAPSYSASKASVISLVRTAAIELAPREINVNAIAPGYITTAMGRDEMEDPEARRDMEATTPWPRLGWPDDVARAVGFLVSDDAAWITGVTLPVDGGFSA